MIFLNSKPVKILFLFEKVSHHTIECKSKLKFSSKETNLVSGHFLSVRATWLVTFAFKSSLVRTSRWIGTLSSGSLRPIRGRKA
jgi:hypothetical protein